MKKRIQDRERARQLRLQGMSLGEIGHLVGASKGAVSVWVRDVELSSDAQQRIDEKNPARNTALADEMRRSSARIRSGLASMRRIEAKRSGADRASTETDPLFVAGVMLYWGEGTKVGNTAEVSNSDPALLRVFVRFLTECFGVERSKVRLRVCCYDDNGLSRPEIEQYWLDQLSLDNDNLRKSSWNLKPASSEGKSKRRQLYGTAHVSVCSVGLLQQIIGAVEQYGAMLGGSSSGEDLTPTK